MKKTNAAIRAHFKRYAPLRAKRDLLVTVPGIGPITAAKILAEVPEIESFEGARQVAAYAGLTPKEHITGSSVRGRTRLSKIGNARIRTALYMPAVVSIRCNPLVRALAERLRAKGKVPMVIIGAAMRKLLHLAYGVLKHGKPFDPAFAAGG